MGTDYFEEEPEAAAVLRQRWAGDPAAVAATTGCTVEQLALYLVHLREEDLEQGMDKAFPDDEFELAPGWEDRLPGSGEWSL